MAKTNHLFIPMKMFLQLAALRIFFIRQLGVVDSIQHESGINVVVSRTPYLSSVLEAWRF